MKLFQYYEQNGSVRVGAVTADGHMPLPEHCTIEDLLIRNDAYIDTLLAANCVRPLSEHEIHFAPVLSNPKKILCIGLNYNEHIDETGLGKNDKPGFPPVFTKFSNALIGHKAQLHLPKKAVQFDYEAELVIVMGRTCKEVSKEEAMDYIAGFAAGNDFSARDMQFASSQWTLGKACDGFAPTGPYFVSRDAIDCNHLNISCKVNGVLRQNSNTCKMIYTCAEIVSYLSQFITLEKGDLIFTGTPSGVILGKEKNQQQWLKSGDVVTVEIQGLGTLENTLV